MAKGDRLLSVARPRVILPAAGAAWGAAAILHAAHAGPLDPALAAAALGGVLYGTRARDAAVPVTLTGGWVAAAAALGPAAGPYDATVWPLLAITAGALWHAHRHPAVQQAKRHRAARLGWLHTAHRYRLGGSHLIAHEETRLGERQVLDTSGTGRLASQIASGDLAERVAQDKGLPLSRVQVRTLRPGRVEISTRYRDPWARPTPHPVLDPDPELSLPVPGTIAVPLIVGQDPDHGAPLTLPLWDEDGAKNILIVAKKRAGKTTLQNCLRERVTAANDAELWNINVSKGTEDREWAPACHRSALGPGERKKALAILRAACKVIDDRGAVPRDTPVFRPSPWAPLIVINIDEIDALASGADFLAQAIRKALAYIASKNGSEGVALVIAGQRGTADWMGGSNVRTQIDYVCMGKVNRRSEVMHAAGDAGLSLPDMSAYGEGRPGVWVIAEIGGEVQMGRTFNLRELTDIRKIAASRAVRGAAPPPVSEDPLDELTDHPGASGHREAEDASGIAYLDDGPLEDALPEDMRDKLRRMDARTVAAREAQAQIAGMLAAAPQVAPENLAASTAARWRQVAEQAEIPGEARERLLALLAGEGVSGPEAARALGVKPWTMRTWLERLRQEGLAEVAGQKRGARWRLVTRPDGDAQ